jgi:hypothetical protein
VAEAAEGVMSAPVLEVPEISDLDLAFAADALSWMPPMEEIPDEFKRGDTKWNEIVRAWFFHGLPSTVQFHTRNGVDPEAAFRAVSATLGSYAPKHEHKEAAAAYMLSCWFKKVAGWKRK